MPVFMLRMLRIASSVFANSLTTCLPNVVMFTHANLCLPPYKHEGGAVFLSLDTFDTGRYLRILTLPVYTTPGGRS